MIDASTKTSGGQISNANRVRLFDYVRPWLEPLAVSLTIVVLACNLYYTYRNLQRMWITSEWVKHTYEVLERLDQIKTYVHSAQRQYLEFELGRDPSLIEESQTNRVRIRSLFAQLDQLVNDDSTQQQLIGDTASLVNSRLAAAESEVREIEFRKTESFDLAETIRRLNVNDMIEQLNRVALREKALMGRRRTAADLAYQHALVGNTLSNLFASALAISVLILVRHNRNRSERLAAAESRSQTAALDMAASVVNALPNMIAAVDPQGRILASNEPFRQRFRLSMSTGATAKLSDCLFFREGEPLADLLVRLRGRQSELDPVDLRLDVADNQTLYLSALARNFSVHDSSDEMTLLVLQDRTQQLLTRQRADRLDRMMKLFIEQVEDYAIFTMDPDRRTNSWNVGVQHVLGFTEDKFLNRPLEELIYTPEAIAANTPKREFEEAELHGRANNDQWMIRSDRVRFWASGIMTAIRDEFGNLLGYSKVMRDLTQRKLAEQELSELAARLAEEDRRKNEFLATLAHELRNPLAPIKNAVQLLAMKGLDAESEELRETMERQVEQLIRLIDDLMDMSRISRGKLRLRRTPTSLRHVIDSAVETCKPLFDSNKQALHIDCCDEPVFLNIDATRVTQAVTNLLTNASRYSPVGSTTKLIAGREHDVATVQVIDQGVGISKENLPEVFTMFSQLHDETDRGSVGLGLGLTLVKTLVELHGGSITAESDGPQKGSKFTIRLSTLDITEIPETPVDEPQVEHEVVHLNQFRVLLIDDMRAVATVMRSLLKSLQQEVTMMLDPNEALAAAREQHFDLIFSDISMPGLNGYDLVRQLRLLPQYSKTPIIAMTGYGHETDRVKAISAGFDDHLVKPVDIRQLKLLLQRLSMNQSRL